jgi:hypothetical protein
LDPEPYQRKVAEIVSDDEGWRDGLEDSVATPLLDWALRQTDDCLTRAVAAEDATPEALDERAYAAADQARALLTTLASRVKHDTHGTHDTSATHARNVDEPRDDEPREGGGDDVTPLLGPPLYADPEQGRAAVDEAMAAARGGFPSGSGEANVA